MVPDFRLHKTELIKIDIIIFTKRFKLLKLAGRYKTKDFVRFQRKKKQQMLF